MPARADTQRFFKHLTGCRLTLASEDERQLILNRLTSREKLLDAFDIQIAKAKNVGRLDRIDWQTGLPLRTLDQNRFALVEALSKDLRAQTFQFGDAKRKLIRVDKDRLVYEFGFLDRVVLSTFAKALQADFNRVYSHKVYSYKPGCSSFQAVRSFARYLRHYTLSREVSQRFLGVWRFDVKSYSDNILVGESSRLWSQFESGLVKVNPNGHGHEYLHLLFKQGLRPNLLEMDELAHKRCLSSGVIESWVSPHPAGNIVGIPTGSALAPIAANLYLSDLDRILGHRNEFFYGRYGDDVIFAAPLYEGFEGNVTAAKVLLQKLNLSINPTKEHLYELNGAGIPKWKDSQSSLFSSKLETKQDIEFLGWRISHSGVISSPEHKLSRDAKEVSRRLANHRRIAGATSSLGDIAHDTVALTNAFRLGKIGGVMTAMGFAASRPLSASGKRSLELRIARLLSSSLTGIESVRTFRQVRWRSLINDFKLAFQGTQSRGSKTQVRVKNND